MRFLKYIFFLLLIIIIGVSIYIATLDGSYNIKQSKVIKAPIEVVFNTVNDFKSWKNWGPWYEIDSTIVASYPKVTSGVGASYSWSGTDGNGSIKTLSLIPNKEIIQQIDFGTGSTPEVYWLFTSNDNGTEITWGMKGKSNFMEKLYWLTQGGIEKNMTPMYKRGLELLNNYILKELEKHTIEIKGVVDYGGGYYLYQTTSSKINDFGVKMNKILTMILDYMKNNDIDASGKPFTITHQWDEENKTTMFSTCVPVKERIITTEDILTGFLKPQKTFKTILKGDYKFSYEAWQTAFKALKEQGLIETLGGEPFEVYTVGPRENINPSKWVTEIYIPIK
ncbi:effector binding domain-containing protein [Lutibacter sp.]|uniref:SRPBCC family protein n=1 Tax=Lutibacter sp. TaxID=1925666 RepID=UPI0025BD26D7|nr:effector binding domain-containing protein [Lutibacter sp.]MCF6168509.1 effector binding domain-containing protein [Lutibacter sp.]